MRFKSLLCFRWHILSVLALGFLAKAVTESALTSTLTYSLIGLLALVLWVYLMKWHFVETSLHWNQEEGRLAVVRPWSVEVSAARKMDSVPLGIDLTHSASKVLRALHVRLSEGSEATLSFYVSRPLTDEKTSVGMVVTRSGFNLLGAQRTAKKLAEQIAVDVRILESAMRAAYPHLPVVAVSRNDLVEACSGGLGIDA